MPGGDRTGPAGQGEMTGRGMGVCNTSGTSGAGRQFFGFGRGFGSGGGRGRGAGRGMGRGFGFWRMQPEVKNQPNQSSSQT